MKGSSIAMLCIALLVAAGGCKKDKRVTPVTPSSNYLSGIWAPYTGGAPYPDGAVLLDTFQLGMYQTAGSGLAVNLNGLAQVRVDSLNGPYPVGGPLAWVMSPTAPPLVRVTSAKQLDAADTLIQLIWTRGSSMGAWAPHRVQVVTPGSSWVLDDHDTVKLGGGMQPAIPVTGGAYNLGQGVGISYSGSTKIFWLVRR